MADTRASGRDFREQLAVNLGADVGEEEAKAIEAGGQAARELSRRLRADYDVPSEEAWESFWPSAEARRYRNLVERAQTRMGVRLRNEMRERWGRLTRTAELELGDEFRASPPPDWLSD